MKNFEKYIDEGILYQCRVHTLRTRNEDCHCDEIDDCCKKCARLNMQWLLEEYKEPIQLTHDEYVILKNVDKKYKYITRDGNKYDLLGLHERKPSKSSSIWFSSDDTSLDCYNHLFQFIKWEDEEPYEIAKLIEDYEKEHEDE